MKRVFDLVASALGLVIMGPLMLPLMFLVWRQDKRSPFYKAPRVGRNGKLFTLVKLRTMVVGADKSGVDSTAANDMRITSVGKFLRAYKLDEFPQLWNVLKGEMSLVGPRPNVQRDVALYTGVERGLLAARPGITDISSIVFSDEGRILEGREDPDLAYNQLIRPWKSRLGLFYIQHQSIVLDIKLIFLTLLAIVSREKALLRITELLRNLGADPTLCEVAERKKGLVPSPPPGSDAIVTSRSAA